MPLDKIIDKIAALGIPGIVLVIIISTTGLAGGAALVAALAVLGGPLGMMGGIAALGLMVLISKAITTYGIEKIVQGVVGRLKGKGLSKDKIKTEIEKYPISKAMKYKIIGMIG